MVEALTPGASECGLIWTQSLYRGNWTALVAQTVTNLPAMLETCVRSLGREDPWRRKQLPTLVFLPGEFHGQRSLKGDIPWARKELDMTERLTQTEVIKLT